MAFEGFTLPAPSGGLNLVDPIDNMPATDALELENMVPTGALARVRYGYEALNNTGIASAVRSLYGLPLLTGADRLVGCANNKIWEFFSDTDITGATVPTSDEWNGAIFANRLYLANGADTVQVYDGTSVANCSFTGVTLANLINVSSFKERLYFVEENTLKFWYGNSRATGSSALVSFDLQYAVKNGGYLLFAGSWTNQLASTSSDLFFAVTSEGEVLFYNGSYPGDTTTPWALVARFLIAKPLGFRSFVRVGNDVWILTQQGIVPISALFTGDINQIVNHPVCRKINPLIVSYAAATPFSHLWHGVQWGAGPAVYITIPTGTSSTVLAVYNQTAGGWCRYSLASPEHGITVATSDGNLYYGGKKTNGIAFQAETGFDDDGDPIAFNGRCPFTFLGKRGNYKTFVDIRPLMRARRTIDLRLGLDTDFKRRNTLDPVPVPASSGGFTPWGAPWGSPWSAGVEYIFERYATAGQGHSAAIRFSGTTQGSLLELYAFELRINAGGQT